MLGCSCGGMSLLPHGVHGSAQLCTDPKPLIAPLSLSVGTKPLKQLSRTSVHKAGDCWGQFGGLGAPLHPRDCWPGGRGAQCCSCGDLCVTAQRVWDASAAPTLTLVGSPTYKVVSRADLHQCHMCVTPVEWYQSLAPHLGVCGSLNLAGGQGPGATALLVLSHLQGIDPAGTAERWGELSQLLC